MWTRRAKFCLLCATPLELRPVKGRERLACPAERCQFVLYENPASAAAAVVRDAEGRVLLIRRRIEPYRGAWALPAGYQEADERPEDTLVREVFEETGMTIEVDRLFDYLFIPDDHRKPANVAVYLCRPIRGELRAGHDAAEAGWFHLDALPDEIGFDNQRLILSRLPRVPSAPEAP